MMKNIEIKINRETRMVDLSKSIIGNDGENLQGNLVFFFVDGFVKGQARLEYITQGQRKYAMLQKGEDNYYIPIKSVMTKKGQIDMQLVVTEGTDENEIPIFKSNLFYVTCKESINAEIEEDEGYYQWIEIANTKLNEVDEAIEELASQSNYAKEQGDYAKEQGTNAKNIAEETEKKAEDGLFNGKSLEFVWQGTKLGVRLEGQEEYQFVDLQGVQGEIGATGEPFKIKKTYGSVSEMNADFGNMVFGDYVMIASSVEVEDNAKLYTRGESAWIFISDFSGAMGIRGETGLTPNIKIGEVKTLEAGSQAKVTRSGSNEEPVFNFEIPKGDKGDDYVLTEEDKVEIGEKVNTEYEKRITENEKDIIDIESYLDSLTPKSSAKGELVHITDALPLATFENKVSGNVKQETTTGNQLLNIKESTSITTRGVTSVVNDDESITVSGTYTSTGFGGEINLDNELELIEGETYTFIMESNNKDAAVSFVNESWGGIVNLNKWNVTKTITGAGEKIKRIVVLGDEGVTVDFNVKLQINKGSTALPIEKFTNGASPNPEYPQEIEVIEGDLSYKVNGKNLFDLNYAIEKNYMVEGNVTTKPYYTIDNNGYLNATFTNASTGTLYLNKISLKAGTYTLQYKLNLTTTGERVVFVIANNFTTNTKIIDKTEWNLGTGDISRNFTFTLSEDSEIGFAFTPKNGTSTLVIKDIQLELGEVATEIEPYKEQITYLDLKGNWVGKINDDIKDYLVTDKKKYWLDKSLTKEVLNGEDNPNISYISYDSSTKRIQLKFKNGIKVDEDSADFLCSHYRPTLDFGAVYTCVRYGDVYYFYVDDTIKSVSDWNAKLKENPMTMIYQTNETKTEDLGELPEPIKTFEGVNNIQLLANLDTELQTTYALDLKKYYDNKIANLSSQII